MEKINVLDKGYVELIDYMGSDYRILESARISTGAEAKKGDDKDRGLIRYMYRNGHLSPYEQCVFTFRIKMPIFVMRQFVRHRTQSINEISARYSILEDEYYTPESWREQGVINHQGSGNEFDSAENSTMTLAYVEAMDKIYDSYHEMIDKGVAKEMSRFVMPVAQYTEIYTTMNLRNLFHLLELRLHQHAQYEIRVYAEAILKILEGLEEFKWSVEIFKDELEINNIVQELKNKYKTDYKTLQKVLNKLKD